VVVEADTAMALSAATAAAVLAVIEIPQQAKQQAAVVLLRTR